jgi:hypothetical protein
MVKSAERLCRFTVIITNPPWFAFSLLYTGKEEAFDNAEEGPLVQR